MGDIFIRILCRTHISSRLLWVALLRDLLPLAWHLVRLLNLDSFVTYSRKAQSILVVREMAWYVTSHVRHDIERLSESYYERLSFVG